ncbi:MAG: DUF2860 family protein [Desulfuromonadales bacterium]|jgi:hypothetical protein
MKPSVLKRVVLFSVSIVLFSGVNALAIEPIPEEPGWSGFVNIGLAYFDAETNMVAGVDNLSMDVGKSVIDSLDASPDSESFATPQFNLNVNYTFSTGTQIFLGNSLEDAVQFDTASVLGVRQQFRDRSILEFSSVSTPFLFPIQVWEDPYVTGVPRRETDQTSRGFRLEYDKILGSGFGFQYTQRETDIDNERSGLTQLGLSPSQARLLDRQGDVKNIAVYYQMKPIGRNIFKILLRHRKDDLDGDAMAGDFNQVQLTHVYLGQRFTFATNLYAGQKDFDASNPIFSKTRDDDVYGVGLVVYDKGLFNSESWVGQATLLWYEQDSNIDFYDARSSMVSLGVQYRF